MNDTEPVIQFREAQIDDIRAIHTYLNELCNEHLPTIYEHPGEVSTNKASDFVIKMINTENSALFVADENGRILGTLDFHGSHRIQQRHLGEFAVSVAASRRGQGIGSKLIQHMLEWTTNNKITRIELEVFAINSKAIKLYQRFGFKQEGVRAGAVIIGGTPVDIILMARRSNA